MKLKTKRPTDRRAAIAGACIRILARQGAKGLTHRAVDKHLKMPEGSTSYYFRTRDALWRAAIESLVASDRADVQGVMSADGTVDAEGLLKLWSAPASRNATLARFEIYLAASRNAKIRSIIMPHRHGFFDLLVANLTRQGVENPRARALDLIAHFEGRLLQLTTFEV